MYNAWFIPFHVNVKYYIPIDLRISQNPKVAWRNADDTNSVIAISEPVKQNGHRNHKNHHSS